MEIMSVFIKEEDNKEKGTSEYVPPSKPKKTKLTKAQIVRKRQRDYSNKIAVYKTNEKLDYVRPDNEKRDLLDLKTRGKCDISEVGRVVAYKQ